MEEKKEEKKKHKLPVLYLHESNAAEQLCVLIAE